MSDINTHHLVVDFGKHKGVPWTRVPVSYLRWLVNTFSSDSNLGHARTIAEAELKRRGSTLPTIELSGHAVDRASLNCRALWYQTAKDANEGLYSWLARIGREALDSQPPERLEGAAECEIPYLGLKLVFVLGEYYPILKTVMPQ